MLFLHVLAVLCHFQGVCTPVLKLIKIVFTAVGLKNVKSQSLVNILYAWYLIVGFIIADKTFNRVLDPLWILSRGYITFSS